MDYVMNNISNLKTWNYSHDPEYDNRFINISLLIHIKIISQWSSPYIQCS